MHLFRRPSQDNPHICFFLARLGAGGIGKMRLHLTRALIRRGYRVDLVLGDLSGPYVGQLDKGVRVHPVHSSHGVLGIPLFASYLRRRRPRVVVCEKLRVNVVAHRARRLAGVSCRIYASVHGLLTHKLYQEGLDRRKVRKKERLIQRWYGENDGFLAVSKGIAVDLHENFQVPGDKIHVVHNPVVTREVMGLSRHEANHPWLKDKTAPVVLSAGRLDRQKGFDTLLEAFAGVVRNGNGRLIILGEGPQRPELELLIDRLGLRESVSMPGFVDNPYPFMRHADAFVLSSRWEGFGNVLVEAMAFGTPVVSTDCPVGPREILEGGRLGRLVPVDDVPAMTEAILETLRSKPSPEPLIRAAGRYTDEQAAQGYLKALGFE
ncbi:MAG: glycosyltransferase [Desulfacinum sp.]|nr:glycosyltransferase [Desulfacinum sp.]